jgi:ABC-type uncharacterized transport system permease subunit
MDAGRRWTPGTMVGIVLLLAFFGAFLVYPVGYVLREAFRADGGFTLRYFGLLLESPVIVRSVGTVSSWRP